MSEYPPGHRSHRSLFVIIQRRLSGPDPAERNVPPELLAEAIRLNPDEPLPPDIRTYLVGLLSGDIKPPRGRRRSKKDALQVLKVAVAKLNYDRNTAWLKARKVRGDVGWPCLRASDWWGEPIHVRAAMLTARQMRKCWPNVTHRHILNEISLMFKSTD